MREHKPQAVLGCYFKALKGDGVSSDTALNPMCVIQLWCLERQHHRRVIAGPFVFARRPVDHAGCGSVTAECELAVASPAVTLVGLLKQAKATAGLGRAVPSGTSL